MVWIFLHQMKKRIELLNKRIKTLRHQKRCNANLINDYQVDLYQLKNKDDFAKLDSIIRTLKSRNRRITVRINTLTENKKSLKNPKPFSLAEIVK